MEFKVGDIVTFISNPSFTSNERRASFKDSDNLKVSLMLPKFKHYRFIVCTTRGNYLGLHPSRSDTVHRYYGSSSILNCNLRHAPTLLLLRKRVKD